MRARKDIEDDLYQAADSWDDDNVAKLQLEVLLDIRTILMGRTGVLAEIRELERSKKK